MISKIENISPSLFKVPQEMEIKKEDTKLKVESFDKLGKDRSDIKKDTSTSSNKESNKFPNYLEEELKKYK